MSHTDDEVLALMALGEQVSTPDADHVLGCPRCQSRVDQLAAVVASARAIDDEDRPIAPPATVWQGIVEETGIVDTTVTPLIAAPPRRRGRTWLIAGVAAAVGLVVGGAAVTAVRADRSTEEVVAQSVVAQGQLDPIDASGLTGTAVVRRGGANDVLTVDIPGLPTVDGYYEVWMATPDTSTMVAVGALVPGGPASFLLPSGLDPASFPVVDVSVEHFDGVAAHSALSVARGHLHT